MDSHDQLFEMGAGNVNSGPHVESSPLTGKFFSWLMMALGSETNEDTCNLWCHSHVFHAAALIPGRM